MDHRKNPEMDHGAATPGRTTVPKSFQAFILVFILPFFLTGCLSVASTKPPETQPVTTALQTQPVTQPLLTAVPAPQPVGIVSGSKVNLRSEPSTDSEILGQAVQGDQLVILKADHTPDWHQVEYQGEPAYIHADFIVLEIVAEGPGSTQPNTQPGTVPDSQPDEADPSDDTTGKINTGTVNIRSEADQSSAILGRAYGGAILTVTKAFYTADWHQVEFEGEIGYVHVDLLDLAD